MIFKGGIDAHVHVWDKKCEDDILIVTQMPEMAPLAEPALAASHIARTGARGGIVVQSAPSVSHSDWLRKTCRKIPGVIGVVGWIDPLSSDAVQQADALIADPLVCGIRLMINRMENPDLLDDPAVLHVLGSVAQFG